MGDHGEKLKAESGGAEDSEVSDQRSAISGQEALRLGKHTPEHAPDLPTRVRSFLMLCLRDIATVFGKIERGVGFTVLTHSRPLIRPSGFGKPESIFGIPMPAVHHRNRSAC